MKKRVLIIGSLLVLMGAGCGSSAPIVPESAVAPANSPETATYFIDGKPAEMTKVFGQPVYRDLDGDGDQDAAVLLVQDPGGSGTFYYVAAAINTGGQYRGTEAVLLGDRVAPQNVEVRGGVIIANYAVRKPGEPFTTQPSQGVSKYLKLQNGQLVETTPP